MLVPKLVNRQLRPRKLHRKRHKRQLQLANKHRLKLLSPRKLSRRKPGKLLLLASKHN